MNIKTNQPISVTTLEYNKKVAHFWNQISEGWKKVWGPHIHHGYYENDSALTPLAAQEKLLEKIVAQLSMSTQMRIADIGCGMGGSSIYLANQFHAQVTGITLSLKQVQIATQLAQEHKAQNVHFQVDDALVMHHFADRTYDLVWSLESCEQFQDKALFLQQAHRILKPEGQLLLATWCSSKEEYEGAEAKAYIKLCNAFDLPYMPTMNAYAKLLQTQGFTIKSAHDWTTFVAPSWTIGLSLIKAYSFWQILKMVGWRGWRFAHQVNLMQQAFANKYIKYGVFIAQKSS